MFSVSAKDGYLVLVALVQSFILCFTGCYFNELSTLQCWLLGIISVFLIGTNFQCVAHNFIHTPFFKWDVLNKIYSIGNTLLIGVPQSIYREHHLNHHQYNNDYRDAETGLTRDYSSIYRYSKAGNSKPESLLAYSLLGTFRTDLVQLSKRAIQHQRGKLLLLESLVMLGALAVIACLNLPFFLKFVIPVWYAGQVFAYAENYLEHYGATPGDRKRNSVSCYTAWYNWVWFNNGYHQEHHYRPQEHWTTISTIKTQLPPESERCVVKGAHWFNL